MKREGEEKEMKAEEIEDIIFKHLYVDEREIAKDAFLFPRKTCEEAAAEIEAVVKARMEKAAERIREYQSQNNQLLQELAAKEAELATMQDALEKISTTADGEVRCQPAGVEANLNALFKGIKYIADKALAASPKVLWAGEGRLRHGAEVDFAWTDIVIDAGGGFEQYFTIEDCQGKDDQRVKVVVHE